MSPRDGGRVSFLLSVLGVLMVVWALSFLLTHRRRQPAPRSGRGTPTAEAERSRPPRAPWTRSDRIAMASLVVGAVLGVLGLFTR